MKKLICIILIFLSCVLSSYAQDSNNCIISSTVEFVVNTNDFIHNENYDKFITETIHFINKNSEDIENILLIGCASPEGNKNWNKHLANIRADKIKLFLKGVIPNYKIEVINDYNLFLQKTGLDESDYRKLRATYIEIHLKKPKTD